MGDRPEIGLASARIAKIVEAAERAADEIRAQAELRARDRIAEGDRAADQLVLAAEAEARDALEQAL